MKRKLDFVTNSSSTSFTFVLKAPKKVELMKQIAKHAEAFRLTYHGWDDEVTTIDEWDVIEAIVEACQDSNSDPWYLPKFDSIDDRIVAQKEEADRYKQSMEDESEKRYRKWYKDDYEYALAIFEKLKKAKENGFTGVVTIGFGDNHGEICGGRVGTTMDYEGRSISIDDDSFIVFTKQDR